MINIPSKGKLQASTVMPIGWVANFLTHVSAWADQSAYHSWTGWSKEKRKGEEAKDLSANYQSDLWKGIFYNIWSNKLMQRCSSQLMQLWKESLKKIQACQVYYEPILFYEQLPVGLVTQLTRAQHWYHRDQGSNPSKPEFFSAFLFTTA